MEFIEYTIGQLALEIKTGKTPPTFNPEYFDGEIIWIGPSDLKGQKIAEDSERKLSEIALEEKKIFLYKPNTILISTIGEIGKTVMVKIPVASNQQLTGILVNEAIILPDLFYYWIQLNKRILENKANKAIISMLSNKLLKRIKVVFPKNIEDQYKIIGRLNRIQELINRRVETIKLLDEYIDSIFLEFFLENSFKWDYKSLKDSKGIKNKMQGIGTKSNNEGQGKPMVRMNNLTYTGEIILDDLKWIELSDKELENFSIENRNILFNRTNSPELVGKIAVWDKGPGYTFAGYLVKIELDESILNPYYLAGYFNSNFGKMVLKNKARLSGNLANISGTTFLKQLILLPPIDLQKEYEKIYLKFQKQKERFRKQSEILNTFFQIYLQDAFNQEIEIDEDEVFETILQNFSIQDLKKHERLQHLIEWTNKNKNRFSTFEHYEYAWEKLRELIEEGIIEQVLENNEIKLKVV